jgi:2'-5' RNA ligase
LFKSIGKLKYSGQSKLALDVDPGISSFYRSLIPKHIKHQPQRYTPHITVVRIGKETAQDLTAWGKYEGELIEFEYDPFVHIGRVYIWLDAYCERLKEIRRELGLDENRIHYPTQTLYKAFHITIANRKFQ